MSGNAAVIEVPVHTPITGAGATQVVAAVPGGGKVGKTLVALVSWRGIGVSSPVEAGWTEHYDYPDTVGPQLALYTRPATNNEPATYTFNFSGVATRVIATLFYISNSDTGIEAFSAEGSGNSLTPTAPSVVSPGSNRIAVRTWVKSHTNNMIVPPELNIFQRWNTGGSDAGAVGHVSTADLVGAGATDVKVCQLDTFAREWRAVTFVVGPGKLLSSTDRIMLDLSGFSGSISDREYSRLLWKLNLTAPQPYSIDDLYSLAGEKNRLSGVGSTL